MTKTLTDKWREGTLPDGCYYVRFFTKKQPYIEICGSEYLGNLAEFNGTDRAEVLAPVPNYDEYKELVRKSDKFDKIMSDTVTNQGDCQQIVEDNLNRQIERLQKQLAIATKALEYYAQCKHLNLDILAMLLDKHKKEFADFEVYEDGEHAREALKEMEGVK